MSNNYTEETFNCWVPAAIVKGGSSKTPGKRWLQGIASTESTDLQGESVSQMGIDFEYFQKYGYFNDDHKPGTEFRVGQPTECKVTKNGLWVKGFLFNDNPRADAIWNFMQSLEASDADRKMGFSIEGKVKRRDGKKIEKCWIQNVAITAQPVNTNTWAEVVKSLAAPCAAREEKALEAGGNPLVPESLDKEKKEDKPAVTKSLYTLSETVEYLQKNYDMTAEEATSAATTIFEVLA